MIGIDVGGTTVKLGVVHGGEDITYRLTRPTPHDAAELAKCIGEMLREAEEHDPDGRAAISMAGSFNGEGGFDANQLGFENVPLRELLRAAVGRDIPIENDGVCALAAEHASGALAGVHTGLMITLGTGIGGGVIAQGRIYRGGGGAHAELGHMITHADGMRCSCGQTGCWECYASATALSRMAGGMAPRDVIDRVRAGGMTDIWRKYVHEIAQGLIGLCSIFAPERIVIGGGIGNAGAILFDALHDDLMRDDGYRLYYSDIPVLPARFGNDAGIIGAAALA